MARLFGSKDGANVQRSYTKHDTDYWNSGLPSILREYLSEGDADYATLRDYALEQGYSIASFYEAIGKLKDSDAIEQSPITGDYYNNHD
jgi:hypothetical protein